MESENSNFFLICWEFMNWVIWVSVNHFRWIFERFTGARKDTYRCLIGKTAIITGGNSGLGYETSLMLASRGCKIIIATNMECESERKKLIESTDNPNIITKYVNLSNFSSVRKFAEEIKKTETKIDFLINIAGVGVIKQVVSEDGLDNMMQINYLGHFLLTHLLIDQLKAPGSARVVFITSQAAYCHNMRPHDLLQKPDENQETTGYQYFNYYANAKLCVIIAASELGKRLHKFGITVNSLDPGIFNSRITEGVLGLRGTGSMVFNVLFRYLLLFYGCDAKMPATDVVYLVTGKNIQNGEVYFRCKPLHKPHRADNVEFGKFIWETSEKLVGLNSDEKLMTL